MRYNLVITVSVQPLAVLTVNLWCNSFCYNLVILWGLDVIFPLVILLMLHSVLLREYLIRVFLCSPYS